MNIRVVVNLDVDGGEWSRVLSGCGHPGVTLRWIASSPHLHCPDCRACIKNREGSRCFTGTWDLAMLGRPMDMRTTTPARPATCCPSPSPGDARGDGTVIVCRVCGEVLR